MNAIINTMDTGTDRDCQDVLKYNALDMLLTVCQLALTETSSFIGPNLKIR